MLAKCFPKAQMSVILLRGIDGTFQSSIHIEDCFSSQISADINIGFKMLYKGSFLDLALLRKDDCLSIELSFPGMFEKKN